MTNTKNPLKKIDNTNYKSCMFTDITFTEKYEIIRNRIILICPLELNYILRLNPWWTGQSFYNTGMYFFQEHHITKNYFKMFLYCWIVAILTNYVEFNAYF